LATFGITMLAAGPAVAGTITQPTTNPFPVPANTTGGCCGFVTISGSGYPVNTNINLMICDGTSPSAPGWDPNINCDSGTSPPAVNSGAGGTPTWLASDPARHLVFFDGSSPSLTFDCLYPTEADPADGLPHWGNAGRAPCQIIVTTNLTTKTSDQALSGFILPTPGAKVPESRFVVLLPLGALFLLGGAFVVLRRRHRPSAGVAA
jgi:hypothetical protein